MIEELTIYKVGEATFYTREDAEMWLENKEVLDELARSLYVDRILTRTDAQYAAEYLVDNYIITKREGNE